MTHCNTISTGQSLKSVVLFVTEYGLKTNAPTPVGNGFIEMSEINKCIENFKNVVKKEKLTSIVFKFTETLVIN